MSWPSHGPRGRHDWGTYLERGYVDPFRDAVREMPDVDVPLDDGGRTMLMEVLAFAGGAQWLEIVALFVGAGASDMGASGSQAFVALSVGGRPVAGPRGVSVLETVPLASCSSGTGTE